MVDLFAFTPAELAECARRELAMRRRVYPRWVATKQMTQDKADREIAMMRAIAERMERADE